MSSHILSEVERLVTHVGIIHRGVLRFQGRLEQLRELQQASQATLVQTGDNARAMALATRAGFGGRLEDEGLMVPGLTREDAARLNSLLVCSGVPVHEISPRRHTLERIFLDLIGEPS